MELAREVGKPVIVHDRDAHGDCMEITRRYPGVTGVYHCYAGSVEMARELLKLGYYLSFTGVITFKNARRAIEVIREVPIDRLMVETDSPYICLLYTSGGEQGKAAAGEARCDLPAGYPV